MQSGCVICYDSLDTDNQNNDNGVRIIATVCGHVFHNICIQEWLKRSNTCPECRRYVKKRKMTKLFINFCIDNNSDFNVEESLNLLKEQLCVKDIECVEKDKKIMELQTDCAVSEKKNEERDEIIKELQTYFAQSELQILEKDGKIEELQTCFAHSELENLEKDEKINKLQTYCTRSEQEILEKDGKIEELQTCFARSELDVLEKEEKIKVLKTYCDSLELKILEKDKKNEEFQSYFAQSEKDIKKLLQQQIKLNDEVSATKQEVKKLSCIEAEYQKLLKEKNTLLGEKNILLNELKHNIDKRIVEGCPIDIKKILANMKVLVSIQEGKITTDRLATYCSLLKQKFARLKKEKFLLQKELTNVRQKLAYSKKERTRVPIELKLMKHKLKTPQSDSAKTVRQFRKTVRQREKLMKFKDLNSSSISLSFDPNPVNVKVSLPNKLSSQCNNTANCSLLSSLTRVDSSGCKNQDASITEDFPADKRQKISIFNFVKKYSVVSTLSSGTPILRLANTALTTKQKIQYKGNEDSVSSVEYKDFGSHLHLVLSKKDEPKTMQRAKYVIFLN